MITWSLISQLPNSMCEIMHLFLIYTGCPVLHTTEDSDPDVEVGRCYIVWLSDGHASHEIDLRAADVSTGLLIK